MVALALDHVLRAVDHLAKHGHGRTVVIEVDEGQEQRILATLLARYRDNDAVRVLGDAERRTILWGHLTTLHAARARLPDDDGVGVFLAKRGYRAAPEVAQRTVWLEVQGDEP